MTNYSIVIQYFKKPYDCIHNTIVDLFLDEISECLGKDAVLLTLTPKTIGGKNVKGLFSEYVPRKSRFVEVLKPCCMTCNASYG